MQRLLERHDQQADRDSVEDRERISEGQERDDIPGMAAAGPDMRRRCAGGKGRVHDATALRDAVGEGARNAAAASADCLMVLARGAIRASGR